MNRYNRSYQIFGIVVAGLILSECSSKGHEENDSHHLLEQIAASTDSIEYPVANDALFEEIKKVQVELTGEELEFYVPARSTEIKSFPCSNCHNKPLASLELEQDKDEKKAHWEIELIHANTETMNCSTCHDDPREDELVMLSGASVNFNHSYKLCGQCHSTQIKDWIGGAHGKRLVGWKPPRLINTCTNCHNPHKPAFESRWPARFNTEKIKQSGDN